MVRKTKPESTRVMPKPKQCKTEPSSPPDKVSIPESIARVTAEEKLKEWGPELDWQNEAHVEAYMALTRDGSRRRVRKEIGLGGASD